MSKPVSLGIPVVLEWKSGAITPSWLNNYLNYLAAKHPVTGAQATQLGVHALLKLEEPNVPFRLFAGQDLRRIVFPNEQEYTMFLLKWD